MLVLEMNLKNIVRSYAASGFAIVLIEVDKQCEALKDRNKVSIVFNTVSMEQHAKKIER